jgi:enoyl-CoA hydratase/carnithine racemase
MWETIPNEIDRFAQASEIRVVVLRGAGEAAFISGADISELATKRIDRSGLVYYDKIAGMAQDCLYELTKPTVAMIRGFCYGAGVALAACCDIRIAAVSARFSIPAGKLGIGYRAEGIKKLMMLMGPARTLDLFYTASQIDALEAQRYGLVEHVVPDDEIEAYVSAYCARVAVNAPLTLMAAKVAARQIAHGADNYDHEKCEILVRRCFESEDYAEGLRAFRERRPPVFQGR